MTYNISNETHTIQNRKKKKQYKTLRDRLKKEPNPSKKDLHKITTFRKFKKESKSFQKAVFIKIKTYNIVPIIIEKTMTPMQRYKANNLLWACNINVETIELLYELEIRINNHDYIIEYLQDCINGMVPYTAYNKQLP